MVERLEYREDILPLFDNEDVLIEENPCAGFDGSVLYIRPTRKYSKNTDCYYLIKIIFDHQKKCEQIRIVRDIQFNLESKQVECYGEYAAGALTKFKILSILSNYNAECEKFRKYYKNRKIAEIRGICDKFTV